MTSTWEGELGQLDNHLQTHQIDQCPRRPFSCQYCKDFNSNQLDVTTNHWPVCGYYPLPCPNKCGEILQRQNLQSHITDDCPLTIIDCDFQHVGCEVRLPRKDMPAHLKRKVVHHLSLQSESFRRDMIRLQEENTALRQQVTKLTQDLLSQEIYILHHVQ